MVREISDILKQLGWTDGFRIPVSNDENKKLENMVEAKIKEKAQLVADLEEMDERLDALNQHMSNVSHEQSENLKLLAASRNQLENSDHLTKLVRAEQDGLQRELRNMNANLEDLTRKVSTMEEDVKHSKGKVSKLKQLMRWDSEELLAWEDLHTRKEEDMSLLQHFIDEDEARFKELEMKRILLQTEVDKESVMTEDATTEVTMLEQVLDRVAQLYRQAHNDHQLLIHQWENSVQAMHLKDKDINDTLNEILTVRAQGRIKMAELLEAKELDANLKNNNSETQTKADETHRHINALRHEDQRLQRDVHEFENELTVLKRTLVGVGLKLSQQRCKNTLTKKEIMEREEKIQGLKQANEELAKKFGDVDKNLWDAGQRFRHMEDLVREEENLQESFLRNISRLQAIYFRTNQELQAVQDKEHLQNIELQNIHKNKAGLISLIEKLDKDLLQIKNMVYELEFSEQKMRSKLSLALGESRSAAQEETLQKIQQLEKTLQEKQGVLALLTSQVDRLENDCRQMSNKLSAAAKEVEQLQNARQDGFLLVEGGKKQLKVAKTAHHDRLVEHALLRMKVIQMERALQREGSRVQTLSKQRIELESAMKERQLEISLHRDMILTRRKTLNEERCQLGNALTQLKTKRDQLQNRYHIIISTMGKDEFGEFISPAMLKLKVAQEKIMLQQEGDVLDAKILKAEKEIEAMENTLKVVNTSNETYRKSLSMVDKDGPEGEELRSLERNYYQAMVELRAHREHLAGLEDQIQGMLKQLSELQEQKDQENGVGRELETEESTLKRELHDQDLKLHRAESQFKRLVQDLRSRSDSTMFAMEEKDIALRELMDRNQNALEQLAEMAVRFMETAPVLNQYLKEKGIDIPQPGQYLRGVFSSSSVSGASSARSMRSSTTSVSSCTQARRRIFDPGYQPLGSYHGTLQTPSQLVFPLSEKDICCAPHSTVTLGSMSDTHSQSDAGVPTKSPPSCFEGAPPPRASDISSEATSRQAGSVFEVRPTYSSSALSASTEASQTSISTRLNASQSQRTASSTQGSSGKRKSLQRDSEVSSLQDAISVEPVHITSYDKARTKPSASQVLSNIQSPTGSRVSSQGSSKSSKGSSNKTGQGSHSSKK